jgi:chromosome segregation and condensation protein ScpB
MRVVSDDPLERAQRVVLGALLEAHRGPLSRSELAAMLGDPISAHDAVDALARDGLANTADELVLASRAAVRADQLGI